MGLSNELLAELSDGSLESAEYLSELVKNPSLAKDIDAAYKEVQEKKKEFTNALTAQQLTIDETYQGLVNKAKEAVSALDMGQEASDATGKTVAGIAQGLVSHVPEVASGVDAILKELNRLSGWGVNISMGSFGSYDWGATPNTNRNLKPGNNIEKFETGLNWVPFDGFLASLHEGEGILTAEENRIWQQFKNGGRNSSVDYDALGGVMRDNVKPGGDVYLDGRTVGRVISRQQANSYTSLQRSGWQQ